MKPNQMLIAGFALATAACAGYPDVSMNYYLAKPVVDVKVTRTLACNSANDVLIANSAQFTVRHVADEAAKYSIPLDYFDGSLADSTLTVDWYDDGRLKGVNATSAGKGSEVIKQAVALADGISLMKLFDPGLKEGRQLNSDLCTVVNNGQPAGKNVLALEYGGTSEDLSAINLDPLPATLAVFDRFKGLPKPIYLNDVLGTSELAVTLGAPRSAFSGHTPSDSNNLTDAVAIRPIVRATMIVSSSGSDGRPGTQYELSETATIADIRASAEFVPFVSPSLFGKKAFKIALSESGAVTSLSYEKETTADDVLTLANDIDSSTSGATAADKVAEAKAEADLIVQQQRLLKCRADPANCE